MTTAEDPLPELVRNARHASPAVRAGAVKSLGKLGWLAREALPVLTAALDDAEPRVREAAAAAVGAIGPDAVGILTGMLGHSDKYVRRNAVWGLGKLGPLARAVLPELCRSLTDEDPRTASGAAQALGNMGADAADAVPALAEAMRGTNVVLCRLAAKALSQVGGPALPTLITHLHHHDPFVRGEAAVALGWMGPAAAEAVLPLVEVLKSPRPAATPAVPVPSPTGTPPTTVTPTPTDPPAAEETCRANAAQALGRIGPAARVALPALVRAAADPVDIVRDAAELAVRQVNG